MTLDEEFALAKAQNSTLRAENEVLRESMGRTMGIPRWILLSPYVGVAAPWCVDLVIFVRTIFGHVLDERDVSVLLVSGFLGLLASICGIMLGVFNGKH